MTALVLGGLIAVLAVLLVALPFLLRSGDDDALDAPTEAQERRLLLIDQRDQALAALKELEFDHRTGKIDDERICELVRELFTLTPGGIIRTLDLRRPIFRKTAAGGHFGRDEAEFTWEATNRAAELAEAGGLQAAAR